MTAKMPVCRICLAINVRLFTLSGTPLHFIYEKLTNNTLHTEDKRPVTACYICYAQLSKCRRLMLTSAKAESVLTAILEKHPKITTQLVSLVNRPANGLCDPLSVHAQQSVNISLPINVEIKVEQAYEELTKALRNDFEIVDTDGGGAGGRGDAEQELSGGETLEIEYKNIEGFSQASPTLDLDIDDDDNNDYGDPEADDSIPLPAPSDEQLPDADMEEDALEDSSTTPYNTVKTIKKGNLNLIAVPSNWEKDAVLHWPNYNVNELRRDENSLPEKHWRKINCIVKRSNLSTFHEAEQEIEKMRNKSGTDTDTEQYYGTNNREMTFNQLVQDCTMSENISSGTLNRTVEAVQMEENDVLCQHHQAKHSESSLIAIQSPAINTDSNAQTDGTTNVDTHLIQPSATSTDSNAQQNVTAGIQVDDTASFNLMVLARLDSLQESIRSILLGVSNNSVQFEHVMNQFSCPENNKQKANMPIISSEQEMNNFEKVLENPQMEAEWKNKFSIICGKGKGRGINNAYALVDAMFSRSFLPQCSWAGGSRTSEQKICFKGYTKIIKFFFDIVHESDSSFSLLDCRKFFKIVLKNSRQRNDSKQQRTSTTKNRPKLKTKRNNLCNTTEPTLPTTATVAPENSSAVSSLPLARLLADCLGQKLAQSQLTSLL